MLMICNPFHLGEGRFGTPFPQFPYFSRCRIRTSQPLRHSWNTCKRDAERKDVLSG